MVILLNITRMSHSTQFSQVFAADQKYDKIKNWLSFLNKHPTIYHNHWQKALVKNRP